MSRIKGKNTKPELLIRKHLRSKGIRYKIHTKITGNPDLVFPEKKVCVFVNGCFWHMHKDCRNFVIPKTNTEFWANKIQSNVDRDIKNFRLLKAQGWKVLSIWECQIEKNINSASQTILVSLNKSS